MASTPWKTSPRTTPTWRVRRTINKTGIESSTAAVPTMTTHCNHAASPSRRAPSPTESVDSPK